MEKLNLKQEILKPEGSNVFEQIKSIVAISESKIKEHNSEIYKLAPQGSFFFHLLERFEKYTDIPLELPFFVGVHYLSAYMLSNEVKYKFNDTIFDVDLWSILLADSGASKTKTSQMIKDAVPSIREYVRDFSTSTARFLEDLADGGNRKLYEKDEFVKFLANVKTQSYAVELEEILLNIYSHTPVSRKVRQRKKKDIEEGFESSIEISDPAISILGYAPYLSFVKSIKIEDIESGFYPRFAVVHCKEDKTRPFEPGRMLYKEGEIKAGLDIYWKDLINSVNYKTYIFSDEMSVYFEQVFYEMIENTAISKSFIRRLMFQGFKYSVLYHIILGKGKIEEIDRQDIYYASLMFHYLLKQTANVILEADSSELQRLVKQVREVRDRMISRKNRCIPSDLVQNIKSIKNAYEAKILLQLVEEEEK